jgi:glucan phosphoethanolaminetransferase (alkaline phosphatase superfamily)
MYTGLLHLHNLLRWVILILLLVALFRHLAGMNNKRPVSAGDKKVDLFLMIAAHITLLVGLYQWFAGPWGLKLITANGMGVVMKDSAYRFFAIEHLTGMLIAIVLITIGRGKVKRAVDYTAHKKAFWFFLLALIVILASVPWPFREAVSRPWFPGMH